MFHLITPDINHTTWDMANMAYGTGEHRSGHPGRLGRSTIRRMSPQTKNGHVSSKDTTEEEEGNGTIHASGENKREEQTCQLVSLGRPLICIRCWVRRGRGAVRSWLPKPPSRCRDPRAN